MMKKVILTIVTLSSIIFAQDWVSQTLPEGITIGIFNKITSTSDTTAWICGRNGFNTGVILNTTDGNNWSILYSLDSEDTFFLEKLFMFDDNTGWVVGTKDYGYYESLLLKTTDGGKTWEEVVSASDGIDIIDLFFTDSNNGWYYCKFDSTDEENTITHHMLKRTTNGGENWENAFDITDNEFSGAYSMTMFFENANHGWSIREDYYDNKTFWHTTDGGVNWTEQTLTLESEDQLNNIYFIDENNGWVCGYNGTVYNTTNSGDNWSLQYNLGGGAGNALASFSFIDENTGYVCGANGRIRKTTDGGINWNDSYNGYTDLMDIHFANSNIGWAIGIEILKYTNVTNIDNKNPNIQIFELSATNYPNPFNPNTTFSINIPNSSNVELSIFSITGDLIETQDLGYQSAGKYYFNWNARNYPSGTYIYQIKTKQNIFTNKCLLIK